MDLGACWSTQPGHPKSRNNKEMMQKKCVFVILGTLEVSTFSFQQLVSTHSYLFDFT
jgi:hypothetical protein